TYPGKKQIFRSLAAGQFQSDRLGLQSESPLPISPPPHLDVPACRDVPAERLYSFHIALFGTSADPPTLGHQVILQWLSDRFDHVAVWASDNPFKPNQIPLHHRTQMLQILLDDLAIAVAGSPDRLQLHPELSSPRALLTLEQARQIWSDAEFTWVLGADLVRQLPQWYHIDEFLAQVRLLIIPRPGYELQQADLHKLETLGARWTIAPLHPPAVSSTAYRTRHQSQGIPTTIQTYIQQERLYEWQSEPQHEWQLISQNIEQRKWQHEWQTTNLEPLNASQNFRCPVNR
ncbi:MAG: nicotinate-nucleotide adenylyltransferase, partial [Synechococcales bacterium]|nr:nicotinate-nucleotide adenylyltransferase [Synechococcales bacterium]